MRLISFLAALFIRALGASLRLRHVNAENIETPRQYIITFWHAHLLLMLHSRWRKPMVTMTSRSKDGDYVAQMFRYFGVVARRGSSSRGSTAALREVIRDARGGTNVGFTPDGPRGPARVAKIGVIYLAKMTGLPIVPVAFAAQKKNCCAHGTA